MRGIDIRRKKIGIQIVTAAVLLAAVTVAAYAASTAAVLEQRVLENSVMLYVKHSGEDQKAEAQIGTQSGISASVSGEDGSIPIVTWLLIDNSLSINDADRVAAKQLLTDLVAGRTDNERFNLCTFSDKLNILLEDSQSYADLKTQIDQIENVNQETYLTDVLAEVLDHEKTREDNAFVRVVVISDGVDNNPGGLTRDELTRRLKEQAVPIYALGSKNFDADSDQRLKAMYALSRQTNGLSWTLGELENTLTVSQAINGSELPVCVEVTVPETLQDGSVKGVQITFSDGAVAETQAVMPFGGAAQQTAEPPVQTQPEPVPAPVEEPEPEAGLPFLTIVLAAALAAIVIGGGIFFLVSWKKGRDRVEPVKDPIPDADDGETEAAGMEGAGGDTAILIGDDRRLTLCLTDRADPNRHFETPLRERVSIGRSSANQIVLNYDKSVSGAHCEVFISGSTFKVRDLGSRNGTCVDGMQVGDMAEISSGSVLKLGRVELVVEIR